MQGDSHREGDAPQAGEPTQQSPRLERQRQTMTDWSNSGDVFASILAGLGLGYLGDWLFGTDPWLVVIGVVAGFAVGFWRMYERSKDIVDAAMQRQRYDGGPHINQSATGEGRDDGWSTTGMGGWDG